MKKGLTLIALSLLLGCSDSEIELPEGSRVLVVEGWVTDQPIAQWVKVSETTSFTDSKPENVLSNATVVIQKYPGTLPEQNHTLSFDNTSGKYLSNEFIGERGESYRVYITLEGGDKVYSNWEVLNPVSPIDDLQFDSFDDTDPETGENIIVFYPVVTSLDPPAEQNQYRYKGYKNGKLLNAPNELILLSDEFNNGQSLPHHIPSFRLAQNDQITIELHSLSPTAFKFLALLKSQTTSLGSSSGTAPAKLIGNLYYEDHPSDIILGFFGASAIQTATSQVNQ